MAKMNKRISAAEAEKLVETKQAATETDADVEIEQETEREPEKQAPMLVTSTGQHPVVIVRPLSRGKVVIGLIIDLVALVGILGLIYMGRVTPAEGLPWLAMLLGIKGVQAARKSPDSAGALLSLIGH